MLRDEQINQIKAHLDALHTEENKIKYEAVLSLANKSMNLNVFLDENGEHQVLWYNNKISVSSFDKDVEDLLKYIEKISQ